MPLNNLTADPDRRALPAGDAVTAIPLTRTIFYLFQIALPSERSNAA
jgi:hypothetical protein